MAPDSRGYATCTLRRATIFIKPMAVFKWAPLLGHLDKECRYKPTVAFCAGQLATVAIQEISGSAERCLVLLLVAACKACTRDVGTGSLLLVIVRRLSGLLILCHFKRRLLHHTVDNLLP
jgi:hypothetical protein